MFSIEMGTSFLEEKDSLKAKIEKWNKIEQLSFAIEIARLLSTSLIKFMVNIVEDLAEKSSTGYFSEGLKLSSNDLENNHYVNILEEQANDISKYLLILITEI